MISKLSSFANSAGKRWGFQAQRGHVLSLVALTILCAGGSSYAQTREVVRLPGSSFACGRDDQGRTTLLRSTHSGFSVRPFAKTLANRKRKLLAVRAALLEQQLALKRGGAKPKAIRARINALRLRVRVVQEELSFVKKCRHNRLPFEPPATPSPSPTATPRTEDAFVNFESMQVRPMALSVDRTELYAVNTADARLEIFGISGNTLTHRDSISTGYDPVSVRLQNSTTAWVVNRISRTVAIVDLTTRRVVRLLRTGDLPSDVAFAAGKAFVTNTGENQIQVFDLGNLEALPQVIPIRGLRPSVLEVTQSGRVVGLAQITTDTALVSRWIVNVPVGPYQGQNPVPNSGQGFFPAMNPALPTPPETGLIVKRGAGDRMFDENGVEWTGQSLILPEDNDVFQIDPANLAVQYHQLDFSDASALAVKPDGNLSVVGTRATNVVRFEPNLRGNFARVEHATLDLSSGTKSHLTLNPHLSFTQAQIDAQGDPASFSEGLRNRSIANPRGVVWRNDGSRGYVVGQGSNNIVQIDAAGARIEAVSPLVVGAGPSGLLIDQARERIYSYNAHKGSISVVDVAGWSVVGEVGFNDPTPRVIREGRPLLYNAHKTSGMGTFSCATCHINGDTDFLNWDLGDPTGELVTITQSCLVPAEQGGCVNHPMKGPFTTQSLQEIVGKGPLHWRGDKNNLSEFNGAFTGLLGKPRELTDPEMKLFEEYVDTISIPPSPYRGADNSVKTDVHGGNAVRGQQIFMATCDNCHRFALGGKGGIFPNMTAAGGGPSELFIDGVGIVPRVDNVRYKLPVQTIDESPNRRSVVPAGFLHDGSTGTGGLFGGFLRGAIGLGAGLPAEQIGATPENERAIQDMIAFVKSFPVRTHAGVGASLTVTLPNLSQQELQTLGEMLVATESGDVAIIAKLRRIGDAREEGFIVSSDRIVADRAGTSFTYAQFFAEYSSAQVFLMLVPAKAAHRMGIDRDNDGVLDGEE